jgi:hypothetical protein
MALRVVALVAALAVAAVAATAASAETTAPVAVVPISGTTADGGSFTGTMTVTDVAMQDGQAVALGTVSGTLTDANGNVAGTVVDAPAAAPIQQQQAGTCTLLSLSIGPFDINVAGLVIVHIEPIALDVSLGGILGNLLCGLLGGGTPPPAPTPPPLPA